MDIRERQKIKAFAAQRVAGAPEQKKIILLYAAITLGLAALVTGANYVLDLQIGNTGGLSNMGTRAVLDTLMQVLPIVQSVIALCLELGYMAAMLRIARGQYVSHRTLKLGFDRFWPLLRLSILRGGIFLMTGMMTMYAAVLLFLLTPLSDPVMAILEPVLAGAAAADPMALLDASLYSQVVSAMVPCFVLWGILYALLAVPLWYRYRLAGYVLIDKPAFGAMTALRESKHLMRGNKWNLFRLDVSLWYYHLLLVLTGFLAYGETLLLLAGITLPWSEDVSFFLFYGLYIAAQFALYYFLRNRVETSYCLAYDSLLPKEQPGSGVVLGNIFQM